MIGKDITAESGPLALWIGPREFSAAESRDNRTASSDPDGDRDSSRGEGEDLHKICGKVCENRFFDRANYMKVRSFLPVCLNDVQAIAQSRPGVVAAHSHPFRAVINKSLGMCLGSTLRLSKIRGVFRGSTNRSVPHAQTIRQANRTGIYPVLE
jgi:hypothetical protein